MNDDPYYRCAHCGATWSYRAVRYVARCRDCGSGLTRTPSAPCATMVGPDDPAQLPNRQAAPHVALRR